MTQQRPSYDELKNIYVKDKSKKKALYDLFLYTLEDPSKFSYNDEYIWYFKDKQSANLNMPQDVEEQYNAGAGGELKDRTDKYGNVLPPKMLSVASSSRFCYLLFNNCTPNFDIFEERTLTNKIVFEKQLKILDSDMATPPHMDAYYDGTGCELFFECKCHEFFDSHKVKLSKAYGEKLGCYFKDILDACEPVDDDWTDNKGVTHKRKAYLLPPKELERLFGVKQRGLRFDIKQLLTHLMGIVEERKRTQNAKQAKLVYVYNIPKKAQQCSDFTRTIDQLFVHAEKIFSALVIKNFAENNNIQLGMYVYEGDRVQPMNENNLTKVL